MPIQNAADQLLSANPGTLPNVASALADWFQKTTFISLQKTVVNHENVETETARTYFGVRQPLKGQDLMMKPSEQRAWRWEMIHAYPDLILKPDEIIKFGNVRYRVMSKKDWKEYGYVEYHIVEDYARVIR